MCVCTSSGAECSFGPLQQILLQVEFSNFQDSSLAQGTVCEYFWSLCSNWLCRFLNRCRHPHYHHAVINKSASISLIIFSRGLQCTVNFLEIISYKSFGDVRFNLVTYFKVKLGRVNIKVPLSLLLLVLDVSNIQATFKKSDAVNLLVMSDLTLDCFSKSTQGWVNIKVLICRLLSVLGVSNVQSTFRKPYATNLLLMSDLTLDRSFKVKLGMVNIKVLISHLFLVLEVWYVQSTFRKSYAAYILVMSDLTLGPSMVNIWWLTVKVHI